MKIAIPLTIATLTLAALSPVFAQNRGVTEADLGGSGSTAVSTEIWVDNWFAMFVNGASLYEDSTAYNTERSFNGERITFNADLPMIVAFEFRDFMENDTGLEYIGERNQQMGDGGAIAQFKDANSDVLGVTDASWRCLIAQYAPIDTTCEDAGDPQVGVGACASETQVVPADWTSVDFDDSDWASATVHSERDVGPKDGYDAISWDSSAELIWGDDLERDNIVLCRAVIGD